MASSSCERPARVAGYGLPIRAQELPAQREVDAQDWSKYQGKILRLDVDGGIPDDNPTLAGVRSHVFTYGHRNPQGLAFAPDGRLFASEQGPKSDDELNLLEPGKNYGWPYVAGFRDDAAYVYGNWSAAAPTPCEALAYSDYELPSSVPRTNESAFELPSFQPPLTTFYTVANDFRFRDRRAQAARTSCAGRPSRRRRSMCTSRAPAAGFRDGRARCWCRA